MRSHCTPSDSSDADGDADVDAGTCGRACRSPDGSPRTAARGHEADEAAVAIAMSWPAHPPPVDPPGAVAAAVVGVVAAAVAVAGVAVAGDDDAAAAAAVGDVTEAAAGDSHRRHTEPMLQLH